MNEKIYVIDDEPGIRETIEEALSADGFRVACFDSPPSAIQAAVKKRPSVVITDLVMPGMDGFEAIRQLKTHHPEVGIIVITGHASLDTAVSAIKEGANDYLIKPFKIAELTQAVHKVLSQHRLMPASGKEGEGFKNRYNVENLVGNTPEIKDAFKLVEKVAKGDSNVLIMGESGTGKEVIARAIHYRSKRNKGPFVSINCAALPENLLESELFGYEKGSFTGATNSKVGLLELAEGGSFFLDEVGDMSTSLQAKILRVIQEKTFRRIGGIRDLTIDFRLISATSRKLQQEVKAGNFREDLYYRLNVIPITTPPLRSRADDIPLFISYFLKIFCERQEIENTFKISDDAMNVFMSHSWPGNVREIENAMERLVALAETNEIDENLAKSVIDDVDRYSEPQSQSIEETTNLKDSVEHFERDLIKRAIDESGGNKNKAAKKLNITRQALQYKLQKYNL